MKIRICKLSISNLFFWELLSNNNTVIARSERSFERYDHVDRSARSMQKLLSSNDGPNTQVIIHKNAAEASKAFFERNRQRVWKES